jgi:mRNA interferase HicA
VKRRDLLALLAEIAATEGVEIEITEGAKHSKVRIGARVTTIPRHREINEITAKAILKQMAATEGSS